MKYLHAHKILHRDLKSSNILMDDYLFPKIADFGLSKIQHLNLDSIQQSISSTPDVKGSPAYMSPEVWEKNHYTTACDVYSFGIIVYEIMTAKLPYQNMSLFDIRSKVLEGNRPEIDSFVPDSYRKLIERCWSQKDSSRPSFEEIVAELIEDEGFLENDVLIDDFLDYVEYINNFESGFDSKKHLISLDKFIKRPTKKFERISINNDNKITKRRLIYPLKQFKQLNKECQQLVEKAEDDDNAQYEVGWSLIEEKQNFPQNTALGIKYLEKSIEGGNIESAIYYCRMLIEDDLIPQDLSKAQEIITNFSESDNSTIPLLFGLISKKEHNYAKAIEYFNTSSKLGNGEAQYEYAKMLYKGIGCNKDLKEAFKYFSMAKNNGIDKSNKYLNSLSQFSDKKKEKNTKIKSPYQNEITFIVFTTLNYKSMTEGDEIKVDVGNDTIEKLQEKIKEIFKSNYKREMNKRKLDSMNILLFLPGGIPFLKGTINDFIQSFPNYRSHLYAIIIYDKKITDAVLDQTFDTVCNIKTEIMKKLLSPDYNSELSSLCEIASVLGYIQHKGLRSKRMIYSIAKFCPFAPMICGLYGLTCLKRPTGRIIIQITAPLLQLFIQMGKNLSDQLDLFSYTVKFMTYFMNIKISNHVPCTEFTRPFDEIGFEKYFNDMYSERKFDEIEGFIAFDPDFRDQDWIKSELNSLQEKDLKIAQTKTKLLNVVPPLSLREKNRVSLFIGKNGPWLYLSVSEDKVDYINPENGTIEKDTYGDLWVKCIKTKYKAKKERFEDSKINLIDLNKVTQLVFAIIDKSASMSIPYDQGLDRFRASQEFFINFIKTCYKFHVTSLYGSIFFDQTSIVRNNLNPLTENFVERMIQAGDRPSGGRRIFTAMKKGADLLLKENFGVKYPNAVLRLIVISGGNDECDQKEQAQVSNFLLHNKIRVDSIFVSNEISKELVAISRYTGGIAIFPQNFIEGCDLFRKDEFVDVNLRQFGPIRSTNVTATELLRLPHIQVNDLDKKIKTKTNKFADKNKIVTSPLFAIVEYEKAIKAEIDGDAPFIPVHKRQRRIINELIKIYDNPTDDFRVFPLKDRVDVWRVLLKGPEGSLYYDKWFYMIIEFPDEYPIHYPLFRFVYPPFHPNITDQGRVCFDTIDQSYRSDISIIDLIGDIKLMLIHPNFQNCINGKREQIVGNRNAFEATVKNWNNINAKNKPEEWENQWKIQPDGDAINKKITLREIIVPKHFLCPISRKIMRNPVKASTGAYYEKSKLERYIRNTPHAVCLGKIDKFGKPIPLTKADSNLMVDISMKAQIDKWIKENKIHIEEEDEDEEEEEDD